MRAPPEATRDSTETGAAVTLLTVLILTTPTPFPVKLLRSCLPLSAGVATAALLVVASPGALSAQNVTVDQGTLLMSRDGRAIGTDQFTIRRSGTGEDARLVATGQVEARLEDGSRTLSTALEVSAQMMEVRAYQVKVSGDRSTEIYLTRSGGRFQAKMMTSRGEELREFRAEPGSVLLDEGVAHHYYFLAARILAGTTRFSALVPRTGTQLRFQATDLGTERIQIAGQAVQARHLQVEDGGGVRDVWVDERGRLLRVVHHGTGLRADRRDLPG